MVNTVPPDPDRAWRVALTAGLAVLVVALPTWYLIALGCSSGDGDPDCAAAHLPEYGAIAVIAGLALARLTRTPALGIVGAAIGLVLTLVPWV